MSDRRRTKHHRRPQSRNGGSNPENIVRIDDAKHIAWHVVFNDMCAPGIEILLNGWFLRHSRYVAVLSRRAPALNGGNPCGTTCSIMCELIASDTGYIERGPTDKQRKAWAILFGRKRWKTIIEEINTYYLDTSFQLELHSEARFKRIA